MFPAVRQIVRYNVVALRQVVKFPKYQCFTTGSGMNNVRVTTNRSNFSSRVAAGFCLGFAGVALLNHEDLMSLYGANPVVNCAANDFNHEDMFVDPTKVAHRSHTKRASSSANFIADAVETAMPAVVNITVTVGGAWGSVGMGSGSGFIISEEGFIVTNHHVVANAKEIKVTLNDGRVFKGRVHSSDQLTDVALVQLVDTVGEVFPVMKIGDSSVVRVGEWVIALGSPLTLSNTATAGIVSSVARDLGDLGLRQRTDFIQTDAAINQGNSGGALINLEGEAIGINTLKLQGPGGSVGGIGFAIPMDLASQVITQLRQRGRVVRPYLGMRMAALTPQRVRQEIKLGGLPQGVTSGVMVIQVAKDSPGSKAGFQSGDIIVEFDGKKVSRTFDIVKGLGFEVGKSHTATVVRKNGTRTQLRVSTTTAPQ